MKVLFRTTDENESNEFLKKMVEKYNVWAIYRFQYRAKDGKFYYEILLNENWL